MYTFKSQIQSQTKPWQAKRDKDLLKDDVNKELSVVEVRNETQKLAEPSQRSDDVESQSIDVEINEQVEPVHQASSVVHLERPIEHVRSPVKHQRPTSDFSASKCDDS